MGSTGNIQYFRQRNGGFATFFALAPVLYLFLVPVLCMRLFAEERRSGTLELLFTRPVSVVRIVGAKYLAGLSLVLLSILPTVIYPVSLWLLSMPAGHIDTGGIVGSYIGLFSFRLFMWQLVFGLLP